MKELMDVEAQGRFGQLLDRVEAGEDIVITRRGKAVARMVPVETDADSARGADARIRAMRQGVTLDGLAIRDLIDEGRRCASWSTPW